MSKPIVLNVKIGLKTYLHNFEIHDEKQKNRKIIHHSSLNNLTDIAYNLNVICYFSIHCNEFKSTIDFSYDEISRNKIMMNQECNCPFIVNLPIERSDDVCVEEPNLHPRCPLKLKLSHVMSHPNLPFAQGQIEKFLILKHLPFINFVLVEIDKVATQVIIVVKKVWILIIIE